MEGILRNTAWGYTPVTGEAFGKALPHIQAGLLVYGSCRYKDFQWNAVLFVISDTVAHSDQMQLMCCSPSEFHVHTLISGIYCKPSVTLITYVQPLRPSPKTFFLLWVFSHISFAITAHKKGIQQSVTDLLPQMDHDHWYADWQWNRPIG